MKALIVDDLASMRIMLSRLLTREGWEAVTAGNGQEALDAFEIGKFNLVIMDVALGDGADGIEVAEKIREKEPGLRIVMISGDHSNETRVKEAGFTTFLAKPFDVGEIKAILRSSH